MSKLKLTIPCTFSDHFKGDLTHTFTFHTGSTHRIDFIAVPLASMAYDNVASTLEVPASHLGDHRAATLSTSLVIHNVKGSSPVRYDPLKFGDPHASEGFNYEISLGSFFAPFLNNSSRLHYFNTYVNFALNKWFPADCRSVRHSHISAYTRECVKIREINRQHVKAVKLLRVPFFVTMHHVHNSRRPPLMRRVLLLLTSVLDCKVFVKQPLLPWIRVTYGNSMK